MHANAIVRSLLLAALAIGAIIGVGAQEGAQPRDPMPRLSTETILLLLDNELDGRESQIAERQSLIDSLRRQLLLQPEDYGLMQALGEAYVSFNNDSAIAVYSRALAFAESRGDSEMATQFKLLRAPQYPLGGFFPEAVADYESIDTLTLTPEMQTLYYDSGRQMYSHIGALYISYPAVRQEYERRSNEAQHNLLRHLDHSTAKYQLNAGEWLFKMGEYKMAQEMLQAIVDSLPFTDNTYARAAHVLADIARLQEEGDDYLYYLALSALSDIRSATLEVTSLQELGAQMYARDDIERAYSYLSVALQNAVQCHAIPRMLQTAMDLPLIDNVHRSQLTASRTRLRVIITVMVIVMVSLVVALILLRRQMHSSERLRRHLEQANRVKDVYISQFLNLCSSYMDKLNQFGKIVERKITTGKVDELLRLSQSGKIVENQTREFYEVFDSAFLHIYPNFVDRVNELLQPEKRIVLRDNDHLNTDLRILAFMRMGIEDSGRIAELLNYSVNTIYTYRNKLKNCAINRDTFDEDIRRI